MSSLSTEQLDHALDYVDEMACDAYHRQTARLVAYANQHMAERPDISDLLGPCPLEVLNANHVEHARFMEGQLRLKSAGALIDTFVWVYKTHSLRGIALRSFPIDLAIWIKAIEEYIPEPYANQISAVYRYLIQIHEHLEAQKQTSGTEPAIEAELQSYFQSYLHALLKPDMYEAMRVAAGYIQSPAHLESWWEGVIQPSMHMIGELWARGEISVGQEHLATAITQRVIAVYYPMVLNLQRSKGQVVVTASPGELHEIGGRMIADLLELHGWNVYYTGANTPAESIIDLLKRSGAGFLCVSTTLSVSLSGVAILISRVRATDIQPQPKILVGGQAYMSDPDLWRRVGADAFASSAREGIAYLEANQATE